MRSPVYRNLDKPFRIYGFSPFELTVLSFVFVGGGELAETFRIHRIWAFLLTIVLAFAMHSFRRSLGELYARRLLRFLKLPSQIEPKLFVEREAP